MSHHHFKSTVLLFLATLSATQPEQECREGPSAVFGSCLSVGSRWRCLPSQDAVFPPLRDHAALTPGPWDIPLKIDCLKTDIVIPQGKKYLAVAELCRFMKGREEEEAQNCKRMRGMI